MRGVSKAYGAVQALTNVDLDVDRAEVCAVLGPNGSGKTTLLSIIAGLRPADAGTVLVDGIDVARNPRASHRHLGVASQDVAVYPMVTVAGNLRLFAELHDVPARQRRERIEWAADLMELTSLLGRPARELSGGEKRRLHTAMALMHKPALLLLDEPTAGVDIATRSRLLAGVRRLAADDGVAVCYTTHYMPEVVELGATLAILDDGYLVARGEQADLIRRYGTSAVELTFDGEPPHLPVAPGTTVEALDKSSLRILTPEPEAEAARLLGELERTSARRIRRIDVVTGGLDSVFLGLTGRRYSSDGSAPQRRVEEATDVVAP